MTLRLRGLARISWLTCSGLLVVIGIAETQPLQAATRAWIGAASVAAGIAILVCALRLTVRLSDDALHIQNWLRSTSIPAADISEMSSRSVATPLSMAVGWGQVTLRDAEGHRVPLAATTGAEQQDVQTLAARLLALNPSIKVSVDLTAFPRTGSRSPTS